MKTLKDEGERNLDCDDFNGDDGSSLNGEIVKKLIVFKIFSITIAINNGNSLGFIDRKKILL